MADVLGEIAGTRAEMREAVARLAGKTAVAAAEVAEMGKAVEDLVDIATKPPEPTAAAFHGAPPWGVSRATVKRIWLSALGVTAAAWLGVVVLVAALAPDVASAFLTALGVEPQRVKEVVAVPGPVRVERVEVPVLGPERVITKIEKVEVPTPGPVRVERVEVRVPGPERVVTKVERVEVPVPGPERIVTKVEKIEVPTPGPVRVERVEVPVPGPERVVTKVEKVEVAGQCAAKPLFTLPDAKETAKLDAACDALASARRNGIASLRPSAAPEPSPPPKVVENAPPPPTQSKQPAPSAPPAAATPVPPPQAEPSAK